jgi:hypothetical protein
MPRHPGRPITEAEVAYGEAYAAMLAYGEETPDDSHLEPERAATIRRELDEAWRRKVRRIYRRKS